MPDGSPISSPSSSSCPPPGCCRLALEAAVVRSALSTVLYSWFDCALMISERCDIVKSDHVLRTVGRPGRGKRAEAAEAWACPGPHLNHSLPAGG